MAVVDYMGYKVSSMYQTEYSNLAEFGSAPTVLGFVHKKVDHTVVGNHIGCMEYVITPLAISKAEEESS